MKKLISIFLAMFTLLALPINAMAEDEEADADNSAAPSIFDLLDGSEVSMELNMTAYYLTQMGNAAVAGDMTAGREAAANRNAIIEQQGSGEVEIDFDDLFLLARLICAEAGSDWLSDDLRFCVGEVVMNRVASPEYPNSISEVIFQKGQYASVLYSSFYILIPSRACVDVAIRLMQGERMMVPSVVFQSAYQQGEIFSMYKDRRLGTTFFCVSPNQELYNEE